MTTRSVRRGQLIAPFGTGAMVVARDGTSLIVAGLDHWFEREDGRTSGVDPDEFRFQEWRLEQVLDVDFFQFPPDLRRRRRDFWIADQPNTGLTIPTFRFPQWHVCNLCHALQEVPLVERGRVLCASCQRPDVKSGVKPKRIPMVQVRFIAICEAGHVQDFPWRQWVHQSLRPQCDQDMKLIATGGATLAATRVKCECGAERSLEHITEADPPRPSTGVGQPAAQAPALPSTYLTDNLALGGPYTCPGLRPWLGKDSGDGCGRPIRGS